MTPLFCPIVSYQKYAPSPAMTLFTLSLWGVPLRRPPSLPPRRCWKTTSDPSGHRCCRSAAASSSSPSSVVSSGSNRSSSTNLPVLQSKFRLSPILFLGNLPRHYSHCRVCVGFRGGELNCIVVRAILIYPPASLVPLTWGRSPTRGRDAAF